MILCLDWDQDLEEGTQGKLAIVLVCGLMRMHFYRLTTKR